MDSLNYFYYAGNNRLKRITDNASFGAYYPGQIDINHHSKSTNYVYDSIGNLIADSSELLYNINWSVYGKIKSLSANGNVISYSYDAAGNRVSKNASGKTTLYVRDASGNVLAVYDKIGTENYRQSEVHLYGSSRLGVVRELTKAPSIIPLTGGYNAATMSTFTRGEKLFELSNHLGNVMATITDKHNAVDTSSDGLLDYYTTSVISAQDYYPFGMIQPGRSYNVIGYRYGFNGKENDNDIKGTANQQDYGMRIYDSRVGRFLSVDILTKAYPWYTPYQFAGNMPIWAVDMDGAEERIIGDSRYLYENLRKAGASHGNALTSQFNRNAGGAAGALLGNAIAVAPYLAPRVMSAGVGGILILSNPSNHQLVNEIAGFTVEILNPDPNGLPINFPGGGDEIAKGVRALFKQFKIPKLRNEAKFILETSKFKYFFDKLDYKGLSVADLEKYAASVGQTLDRLTHNLDRAKSMNEVFAKWGVTDSKQGLEWFKH